MVANERLVASDGKEVMLFPLPYMYISQGENGIYSHQGTLNIDFVGYDANGVVLHAPMYAPCSCKCVAIWDTFNNGRVFQSINPVHCADGNLRYVTFMCYHDNNPIANLGDVFSQGDLFAHTGDAGNVTGDHTHFNTAYGTYAGFERVPPDNQSQLVNSSHIYDTCYVNDTVIVEGLGYDWKTYTGPTPTITKKKNFPWVLYARRLRNRRMY